MIVEYGVTVPETALAVWSTDTEVEARMLIAMACPRDQEGRHYARELAEDQTLENLYAFSWRLKACWDLLKKGSVRK